MPVCPHLGVLESTLKADLRVWGRGGSFSFGARVEFYWGRCFFQVDFLNYFMIVLFASE